MVIIKYLGIKKGIIKTFLYTTVQLATTIKNVEIVSYVSAETAS